MFVKVDIYIDRAASNLADINRTDEESTAAQSNKSSDFTGNTAQILRDRFLSDSYYVKTINYSYMNGIFETDLLLGDLCTIKRGKNNSETECPIIVK